MPTEILKNNFTSLQNLQLMDTLGLQLSGRSSAPADSDLYDGRVYYDTTLTALRVRAGSAWVTLGTGGGGGGGSVPSWEAIYDGDQLMSMGGAALVFDRNAGNDVVLTLTNTGAGSGHVIQVTNVGTGKDINGTSDLWSFSKAGAMVAATAVYAGVAASNSITLTAGDILASDGSLTMIDADNAATLSITNDTATTASVFVFAGSGAFTGNTTSSFMTVTPSGLTTGTALYMPVAALTQGKAIHVIANALTTGLLVDITSSATAITTTGRLLNVAHSGTTGGTATLVEFATAANDETKLFKLSASDVLAAGALMTLSASAMTTGKAIAMTDLDSLTDGMGIHIASAATAITSTGHLLFVNHTGTTGTSAVLSQFTSACTDETVVVGITASSSITSVGLSLIDAGTAMTSGSLLRVSSGSTAALATNGIVSLTATGNFTSTNPINGGFVEVKANSTTSGTIVNVVGAALTDGVGLMLSNGTSAITTGSLLAVQALGVGTLATNGLVSIRHKGIFVSTSNTGVLDVRADAMVGTASNATLVNFMATAAAQVNTTVLNVENSGFTTGYTGSMLRVKSPTTTGACKVVDIIADGITSGGTAVSISAAALTTGVGLTITNGTSAVTSGSLLYVKASGTGTIATNGMVLFSHGGIFSSTSSVGFVNVAANATTAGTVLSVSATGLVDGAAIFVASAEAGLTTGKYLNLGNGKFTVAKFGATVIAGNAQGTDALTITAGDLTVSSGNITGSGKIVFNGIETINAGGTSTALSLNKSLHYIDADAGGDTFTLADGTLGQVMTIVMKSSTGTATITPANFASGTSVTFNAAGDSVVLQFVDTKWFILGGNSYAIV